MFIMQTSKKNINDTEIYLKYVLIYKRHEKS